MCISQNPQKLLIYHEVERAGLSSEPFLSCATSAPRDLSAFQALQLFSFAPIFCFDSVSADFLRCELPCAVEIHSINFPAILRHFDQLKTPEFNKASTFFVHKESGKVLLVRNSELGNEVIFYSDADFEGGENE